MGHWLKTVSFFETEPYDAMESEHEFIERTRISLYGDNSIGIYNTRTQDDNPVRMEYLQSLDQVKQDGYEMNTGILNCFISYYNFAKTFAHESETDDGIL